MYSEGTQRNGGENKHEEYQSQDCDCFPATIQRCDLIQGLCMVPKHKEDQRRP